MNAHSALDIVAPRLSTSASRRQIVRAITGLAAASLTPLTNVGRAHARQQSPEASPLGDEAPTEFAVSADGTRIAYQRAGQGPPIVLIHGTADDHSIWFQVMPALAERFTVHAVDRRGRGESGASAPGTYAIEREFEDVLAVINATGEPAYLLGHSFGAICAMEAALQTEKLVKLILYEPPILTVAGESLIPKQAFQAMGQAVETMDHMLAEGDNEGVMLTFARDIGQVPEEAIDAFRAMPSWQASVDMADTIVREVHAVATYDFDPERFHDLSVPTLLLMGSESPPYMQAASEAVADALPNDQVATLQGQGHLAMAFDPEGFIQQVFAFLRDEH
ncbi:MAG: alpha/beta fold hydrolase [Thermomicrobiales bacterium]